MTESTKPFRIQRLGLLGLGLMGSAVGQEARRKGIAKTVVGFSPRPATRKASRELGAVDERADLRQHRVFNVAGGQSVSVNQLWQEIKRLAHSPAEARHLPPRAGDLRHSLADTRRAAEVLGWKPRIGIQEGLALTHQALGGS